MFTAFGYSYCSGLLIIVVSVIIKSLITESSYPINRFRRSIIQDRDVDKIPSKRRNPVIADLFHRLSYMERRGSGLKKIRDEYKKAYEYSKDYAPEFCSTRTDFTTTLKNLNYRYKKSDSETHLSENGGINEGKVIELMRSNEHITIQAISENLKISRRRTERIISNLRKSEIIERLGSNKTGSWKIK